MYEVYKTPAIVLRNTTSRESDLYSKFYTKEYGLVRATVPAARKESSKHRYGIQEHSICEISFIKGKSGYRIIGSLPDTQLTLHKSIEVKKSVSRVVKILETLVHGEQQDKALFQTIRESLVLLADDALDNNVRHLTELFVLISIIYALGYFSKEKLEQIPEGLLERLTPTKEDILYIQKNKIMLAEMVNNAVFESQL